MLAGGTGSRLWPCTVPVSKQLLPVFDKPMIYYPLATLMESGTRDLLVITRPEDSQSFAQLLGDGSSLGISIRYAQQMAPDGIAAALLIAEGFLAEAGSGCTLVLGDNLFHGDAVVGALDVGEAFSGARIFGYQVTNPEAYGVVVFDSSGHVVGLQEKPETLVSHYAIPGLYVYDNDAVGIAKELRPSHRGELEITDLNQRYLEEGRLEVQILPRGTAWLDTGTFDALLDASAYVKTIEARQGTKVACLEEIAWRQGWISDEQLERVAQPLIPSGYGKYLMRLLADENSAVGPDDFREG